MLLRPGLTARHTDYRQSRIAGLDRFCDVIIAPIFQIFSCGWLLTNFFYPKYNAPAVASGLSWLTISVVPLIIYFSVTSVVEFSARESTGSRF